jgi:hypothetical protein
MSPPILHVDLSGRAIIELVDPGERTRSVVERQVRPFELVDGAPAGAATLTLEDLHEPLAPLDELQGPANDDITTAIDGERLWLLRAGRRCAIPDATLDRPARVGIGPGFDLGGIWRSAVRPAFQVAMASTGQAVAVHAASVTLDGRAVLVAGWSESGKTETALGLMERGAGFLSDKWTLLGPDGEASPFPITIGIRRWALDFLPTLAHAQTMGSRAQFAAARAASAVMRPVARAGTVSRPTALMTGAMQRAVGLADRSAYEIADLRAAYGQRDDPTRRTPTGCLVILVTVPTDPVHVVDADPAWVAARLARTAAYERRSYLGLLDRGAYLRPTAGPSATERAIAADDALLGRVLPSIRCLRVEAPFPTDPTRVADAILEAL